MKLALGLACLMMVTCVHGAPQPGPPPVLSEEFLAPHCRTPKCPANINVDLPYPMDCFLYVKCTQGVSTITACPPDTNFNEVAGTCTDRATAKCEYCWQKAPNP